MSRKANIQKVRISKDNLKQKGRKMYRNNEDEFHRSRERGRTSN